MARHKSQHFLRYQSPCRHSIQNQTNSLDSQASTQNVPHCGRIKWFQKCGIISTQKTSHEADFVTQIEIVKRNNSANQTKQSLKISR